MSKDTIYRQAAIDALNNHVTYSDDGEQEINADCVFHTLESLPSAEPETIVRCKDCKHKYIEEKVWNWVWKCPFGHPGGEEFFCSYGARMDGESE